MSSITHWASIIRMKQVRTQKKRGLSILITRKDRGNLVQLRKKKWVQTRDEDAIDNILDNCVIG
jgi:hypothetical protein